MLRTFCHQSYEVAPSWSGTPSILFFSSVFSPCCWISFYFRFLSLRKKERKKGNSGAGNKNGDGSGSGVSHVIPVLAPKYPTRGLARWSSRPGGKRALNGIGSMFCCRTFCHCLGVKVRFPDEFIAGRLHKEQSTFPLEERILGWIYHKLDILLFCRPFSGSELLPYGNRAWFKYLFLC